MEGRSPIRILSCASGLALASAVASRLGLPITPSRDEWFACGEGKHVVDANVRGTDVYLFQNPYDPASGRTVYDRLMMMLHAIDACRLVDAERVTVVSPYFPGLRQDKRKGRTREGVSTGLFARMLEGAGCEMLITVEPHNDAIVGCFDPRRCIVEPVYITKAFGGWLDDNGLVGQVIASTDVGGLPRARRFAKLLQRDIVALDKERDYRQSSTVDRTTVIGDVEGRSVMVIDDIIDTAGSAVAAVEALWDKGATHMTLACAHPILSGPAWGRLRALREKAEQRGFRLQFAGTDAVVHPDTPDWYHSFSLDCLLADVIQQVNTGGSVSNAMADD